MMSEQPAGSLPGTPSTTGTPARTAALREDEAFLVSELDHHMTPAKPADREARVDGARRRRERCHGQATSQRQRL